MSDTTLSPRASRVKHMVSRALATGRKPLAKDACALCNGEMWMSFFFDGTGNNLKADLKNPGKPLTNVAAIHEAHTEDIKKVRKVFSVFTTRE